MSNGWKKVSVLYRKLAPIDGLTLPLQSALSTSMKQTVQGTLLGDNAAERQCKEAPDYGTVVLNHIDEHSNYFFGELVRFEPGADLPLLQIGTGKVYNLTQAKAPSGHEAVRGVLYFLVVGNNVIVLEGGVVSARAERYLTWLLRELVKVLPNGTHVILDAELTTQGPDGLKLAQIEQITLKPKPLSQEMLLPDTTSTATESVTETRKRDVAATNTLEVLRAAGMDDADVKRLVDDRTDVEVTLQIKFKSERRRHTLWSDQASRLLRNVPEDELTLIGPGGKERDGRIVKLACPCNVKTIGSLYDYTDVARALYEGYKFFVSNGYIDG